MSARILVVDDMLPNIKLLEAKLTKEYYDVVTAQDGFDAIEKARKYSPDLILLDVMMPGMDGFETCRRLRADPELSHIPVVMLTALSEKESRIHGLEVGADDFLTKPINDSALFARVRSLIRLKVMIDELRLRGQTGIDLGIDPSSLNVGSIQDSRIMLVDDDSIQARQVIEKLSNVNKKIKHIANPEEAVEEAAKGLYDLVMVSTQLVEVDGLRVCSQLRTNEQTRNISIIILIDEDDTNSL
jgi:two-component system, cell cycle response regulator